MNDAQLTIILCDLLGGVPGWTWSTTPCPAGGVGVFYGAIPDSPDRAIGVRVYGGSDNSVVRAPRRRVQLRIRGRRGVVDDADQLAALAFTVLQGRSRLAGILHIERTTFGPLGADTNGREERSENYFIQLDNQEAQP